MYKTYRNVRYQISCAPYMSYYISNTSVYLCLYNPFVFLIVGGSLLLYGFSRHMRQLNATMTHKAYSLRADVSFLIFNISVWLAQAFSLAKVSLLSAMWFSFSAGSSNFMQQIADNKSKYC